MDNLIISQDKLVKIDNNKLDIISQGYVIFFIHPISKKFIFLAYCADIDEICYSEDPHLAGTRNIKYAKIYNSIDEAKKDIYKLRYHYRDFIKIKTGIKSILHKKTIIKKNPKIIAYSLNDLIDNSATEET